MSIKSEMEKILLEKFDPQVLDLEDQSDRHIGHAGHDGRGESHFHLTMTSHVFQGVSRIQRQRMVNQALAAYLKQRVHALSMTLNAD